MHLNSKIIFVCTNHTPTVFVGCEWFGQTSANNNTLSIYWIITCTCATNPIINNVLFTPAFGNWNWQCEIKTVLKGPVHCSSVRTGLSVRTLGACALPRFRTYTTEIHTHTIKTVLIMKRPVRFGSYRAFGENAWRSCLATVPDTTEIHTHTIKTVLKRPVQFGSYRAFVPNARCLRFAPRHGSGHHYTHNLIWKPQFRVLCHWSQCWHNHCGLVRKGVSVQTLGACASSLFRTPRKYIHTQQICRPHPVPTSLVASGLKQYHND